MNRPIGMKGIFYMNNYDYFVQGIVVSKTENGVDIRAMTQEEYVKDFFEKYGVEVVTPRKKLIAALRRGDYVIGIDYNPMILHNVFHYKYGKFEMFKFNVIGPQAEPLKLKRDLTFCFHKSRLDSFLDTLPEYDEFIVCRNGGLLDTQNIPVSLYEDLKYERLFRD